MSKMGGKKIEEVSVIPHIQWLKKEKEAKK